MLALLQHNLHPSLSRFYKGEGQDGGEIVTLKQ